MKFLNIGRLLKEGEVCYLVGLVFKISFCYDMMCCHQCQRGRLLDNIVLDVTQISYQSLDSVYRAQTVSKEIYRVYRAQRIHKAIYNVYRANLGIEGNVARTDSTELTRSSKEMWQGQLLSSSLVRQRKSGKDSFYRVHSVISGNSVLTEFTRRLKDFTEFAILTELSRLTLELVSKQSSPCRVGQ